MEYLKLIEIVIAISVGAITIITAISKVFNKFIITVMNPLNDNMRMLSNSVNKLADKVEAINNQQQSEAIEIAKLKEQIIFLKGGKQ